MDKLDIAIQHAEQQCKASGTRLTKKRKQVLSGLIHADKALSAYELVDYCASTFSERIPAMSVYRILSFLESEHLVHKLNLANKYIACAHIHHERPHGASQFLICKKCSKVEEVSISQSAISELQQSVQNAKYQLISPQLEINCLCQQCA